MSSNYYILDTPLPLNQDFGSLRDMGREFIQQAMDSNWTNLNASDAGVTILDQLCFALTELGYCTDFSIRDIVTQHNEKLEIRNQFYLPEEILTTAPVTVNDYKKYVIDGVEGVDNLTFIPVYFKSDSYTVPAYLCYLLVDSSVNTKLHADICKATFFSLNKCRNLGELFLMPQVLKSYADADSPYQNGYNSLFGTITIQSESELDSVLTNLDALIQEYIFPKVIQAGYTQLSDAGVGTNTIFSGPRLKNGWILDHQLGKNRTTLQPNELPPLIRSLKGVISVSGISFNSAANPSGLSCDVNEIIRFDIMSSFRDQHLVIMCKGKPLKLKDTNYKTTFSLGRSLQPDTTIAFGAWNESQTTLPKGKFRDIDTYYSIQNTMPEIFGVGANSVDSNATPFQIAQSRQLKGYLTLFDQVLANQFSQLAALPRLLSFKNPVSGIPSQEKKFYAYQDSYEKKHEEYPVPFRAFSPTYFYRSLYGVPHIKELLKDNDTFDFNTLIESEKKEEKSSWFNYRQDPANSYMLGLKELMVHEREDIERRNDILDHLLARHGESPLMLDAIIDGSIYTGDEKKDRVIVKSMYLQSLGLLSYNRQKAYNFLGANRIPNGLKHPPAEYEQEILEGDSHDFIFESQRFNRIDKLKEQDFINYSALELKLNLLLGLQTLYHDYMARCYHKLRAYEQKKQQSLEHGLPVSVYIDKAIFILNHYIKIAWWFIQQRRGAILIEQGLLSSDLLPTFGEDATTESLTLAQHVSGIYLFLPAFIFKRNKQALEYRLSLFLQNEIPPTMQCSIYEVQTKHLRRLITVFKAWHNSLVFPNGETEKKTGDQKWPAGVTVKNSALNDLITNTLKVSLVVQP